MTVVNSKKVSSTPDPASRDADLVHELDDSASRDTRSSPTRMRSRKSLRCGEVKRPARSPLSQSTRGR